MRININAKTYRRLVKFYNRNYDTKFNASKAINDLLEAYYHNIPTEKAQILNQLSVMASRLGFIEEEVTRLRSLIEKSLEVRT